MAALMIEIPGRFGNHQYYRIDKPVVRIGRALDNDIILSDPTVSPYHLVIRKNDIGVYQVRSIADENGIRMGRRLIDEPIDLTELPVDFEAGRTHIRIVESSHPVAPTRLIACRNGGACIFGHWGWAVALFLTFVALSAIDNFLSTPQLLTWKSFGSDQLLIVFIALLFSVGLSIINRIVSHRWDYPSALSFVSLILIIGLLLDQLILLLDYYFTAAWPGYLLSLGWTLVLLPYATGWFLVRLHHGNRATSMIFIVLLFVPLAYLQLKEVAESFDLLEEFSKTAHYSDTVSPWDIRRDTTLSIDEFIEMSRTAAERTSESSK